MFLFCATVPSYAGVTHLEANPDSGLIGLYPFNGNANDASGNGNDGVIVGATLTSDRFGNPNAAYAFDDTANYVVLPDSLVFKHTTIAIALWFKTDQQGVMFGYQDAVYPEEPNPSTPYEHVPAIYVGTDGRLRAEFWTGEVPQLTLINSISPVNDGTWHFAVLTANGTSQSLYLDGALLGTTQGTIDHSMMTKNQIGIGQTNGGYPVYNPWPFGNYGWFPFHGSIDDIAIYGRSLSSDEVQILYSGGLPLAGPAIYVDRHNIDFNRVELGANRSEPLRVFNLGYEDTLYVSSIQSNNPTFSPDTMSLVVFPGSFKTVNITYVPNAVGADTASLILISNDSSNTPLELRMTGSGYQLMAAPQIDAIRDVPNDQGKQVRVSWFRSIYDGIDDSLRVTEYSLWRRVDGHEAQMSNTQDGSTIGIVDHGKPSPGTTSSLWDFIVTIPAIQIQEYAFVAPTLFDSTGSDGIHWSVFMISAHTESGESFSSAPDSGYSRDNIPPPSPTNLQGMLVPGGVRLQWESPIDPDIDQFLIFRSSFPNVSIDAASLVGSSTTTEFLDAKVISNDLLFYKIVAIDKAGNQSGVSNEAAIVILRVDEGESGPTQFALYQSYPNPFNPSAVIKYDVPSVARVTVKIYDMLGREVAVLVDEQLSPGRYSTTWKPQQASSGVYVCRMTAGDFSQVHKMILVK